MKCTCYIGRSISLFSAFSFFLFMFACCLMTFHIICVYCISYGILSRGFFTQFIFLFADSLSRFVLSYIYTEKLKCEKYWTFGLLASNLVCSQKMLGDFVYKISSTVVIFTHQLVENEPKSAGISQYFKFLFWCVPFIYMQ